MPLTSFHKSKKNLSVSGRISFLSFFPVQAGLLAVSRVPGAYQRIVLEPGARDGIDVLFFPGDGWPPAICSSRSCSICNTLYGNLPSSHLCGQGTATNQSFKLPCNGRFGGAASYFSFVRQVPSNRNIIKHHHRIGKAKQENGSRRDNQEQRCRARLVMRVVITEHPYRRIMRHI